MCTVFELHWLFHPEKAMAAHSSTLAWKIPWMEEPGGLQSIGSLESDTTERLHFHFSLSCIGEGNGNPLQCSCLENPRDGRPGGLQSMGSHRVGHDWSDLAAAAAGFSIKCPSTVPRSNPGFHTVFSCCVSLVFCDLDTFEEYLLVIFRMALNLCLSGVSYD